MEVGKLVQKLPPSRLIRRQIAMSKAFLVRFPLLIVKDRNIQLTLLLSGKGGWSIGHKYFFADFFPYNLFKYNNYAKLNCTLKVKTP